MTAFSSVFSVFSICFVCFLSAIAGSNLYYQTDSAKKAHERAVRRNRALHLNVSELSVSSHLEDDISSFDSLLNFIHLEKIDSNIFSLADVILECAMNNFIQADLFPELVIQDFEWGGNCSYPLIQTTAAFETVKSVLKEGLQPSNFTTSTFPVCSVYHLIKSVKNNTYKYDTSIDQLTRDITLLLRFFLLHQRLVYRITGSDIYAVEDGIQILKHCLFKKEHYTQQLIEKSPDINIKHEINDFIEFYQLEKSLCVDDLEVVPKLIPSYLEQFFEGLRESLNLKFNAIDSTFNHELNKLNPLSINCPISCSDLFDVIVELLTKLMNVLYNPESGNETIFDMK